MVQRFRFKGQGFYYRPSSRRKTRQALMPPKPKELLRMNSGSACLPSPARYWRSQAGSASSRLTVGGSQRSWLARAQMAASKAPLAPSACP